MELLGLKTAPLGMGCWPIGGPFFKGERPLGYSNVTEQESRRTIKAALNAGIRLFDTAAVYGAGHSERLLGDELAGHPDALVVTKIGMGFDEKTKQVTGDETNPSEVKPAIERCLGRLRRDRIDIVLLHLNGLPVAEAGPVFDAMETARDAGKIRAFGWSTDFPQSVEAMSAREGFVAVEHAMHLFFAAQAMQETVARKGLTALIRSPLAMGLLTGKFDAQTRLSENDNRSVDQGWTDYFQNGRANPDYLARLDGVRDLLCSGGRSLTQGALCWLMAKSPRNIPIPGARTVAQIEDSAGALVHGPLSGTVMAEIETLLAREPEGPPRER